MADTWFESYSRHACHEDGCAIQSNNPSSVHFPDVQCGSLVPLINVAYTSWLPGAMSPKVRSLFESSSAMRIMEGPQGSGVNSKTVASQEPAFC
jgi:hypothetical protein